MHYETIGNQTRCIDDEIPFEIPENWAWARLNNIVTLYTGNSINSHEKQKKYSNLTEGYCYIATKDVNNDCSINYTNGIRIPFDKHFRIAPNNSVLMCIEGGSAGKKIAVLNQDVCFGNKLCCFLPIGLKIHFLFYCLRSPFFTSKFFENKSGIIGGVPINTLKTLFVPIPPLAEQHRIVAKLEEILPVVSQYDAVETRLTKFQESFPEALKKSILQSAIQGKLVPQAPNDEPASVLLERIQKEKQKLVKAGKIKPEKQTSFIFRDSDNRHYETIGNQTRCIEDEIPFEIPKNWTWVRLQSVIIINPRNNISDNTSVSFIPMNRIADGFSNAHSSEIKIWKDVKSGFTHFAEGDIGIAKITPCFENRKSVIFSQLENGLGAGTTELHILRIINTTLFSKYLLCFCKSEYFIVNGIKTYTGTAGQQRIGKDYIQNRLFPLPPLAEQHRIVAGVEKLLDTCKLL